MTSTRPADTHRPKPGPPRDYHFPRFERRTLANGMRLVVAPATKLPLATALLVFDAGASADPAGQEGLAVLAARALLEGTATMDGAELTLRAERLGASLDASAGWDSAIVRLTALSSRLPTALALMGEILQAPAFPDREVQRLKAERLAEILQLRAEPRGLADEMFDHFAYDERSRYARPDGGSESSVGKLDREAIATFFAARYRPAGATLIIAGDISPDEAERLATATFGSWTGDAPAPAIILDTARRTSRAVHIVAKSDAPQSELRIGHRGLPRTHPDYFDVVVMNALLGGLFSSRINLNLREAHAYTYGAFSDYEWRRQAGPFAVSTAVKTDVTDAAVREVLHEIDRMRESPVSADELSLATSYLDGVFPIRFETTAAIASALATLVVHHLPDDYYDTYRARIRGVTSDRVLAAARQHIDPAALQVVVVGDPEAIRQPLGALGIGDLLVHDADAG